MNITKNEITYSVPWGTFSIDTTQIESAVSRIGEVQTVTKLKAPELLSTYNLAWRDAAEAMAYVRANHIQAKKHADKLRAIILLDKAPTILKEKGLTTTKSPGGSEDFRQAILDSDDEYQAALENAAVIECIIELLRGKQKSVEMAFTSVKKILGEGDVGYSNQTFSTGNATEDKILSQFGRAR